ncbi:MAG: bifunctional methylenetetrahydrofolate dehydrogenase/methenyltetrahydrofolate cyclohydrolase [Elusimicrobia bacterium CG08_land_8_20_14_0_20_51_18]|nr:MAG: bifunctional methylenetetrahydrofolate dehydrogenase/methenyltetrahydrofolate cyclohydrolase [Elusimicrobia bacterium CG08_land_8_20_14_0_20_51_18]
MKLLEGKPLSRSILETLPGRITELEKARGSKPALAVINYFENSPSAVYVKRKIKMCEKLGIACKVFSPDEKEGQKGLLNLLSSLGRNPDFDAVMVERPLPAGFDDLSFWDAIPAEKDVDALSSLNMGRLFTGKSIKDAESGLFFSPCTALAVIRIMKHYGIDPSGKKITVVGRSSVIGKPVSHMLTCLDATVTLCHSRTREIREHLRGAEIIVLAIGRAKWLKKEMAGENQTIIDVGTNLDESGKMCGDADFDDLKETAGAMTPVPGGVGPVTLACLLEASVRAAENFLKKR